MINLGLAVIVLLKGKIWTGLIGLFVPVLIYVGAIRVARPGSPWARWWYEPGSRKYRRARSREDRFRHPLIRGKIWVQEFIAGRHDLAVAEHRTRKRARRPRSHVHVGGTRRARRIDRHRRRRHRVSR